MKVEISDFPYKDDEVRKISVEIDTFDTWNLDQTLALIILPALKKFKEQNIGVPSKVIKQMHIGMPQMELDLGMTPDEIEELVHQEAIKNWNEIMDKMIWSFQQAIEMYDDFSKDYTIRGTMEYQEKLEEGFALFGKYYRSLWI